MNLDFYGSLNETVRSTCLSSVVPHSHSTSNEQNINSSDLNCSNDSMSKCHQSPVIYPWMRKVHINNPGNQRKREKEKTRKKKRFVHQSKCSSNVFLFFIDLSTSVENISFIISSIVSFY